MSNANKSPKAVFIGVYILLIIPGLNWLVGTLLAAVSGLHLLSKGQWMRLMGLLAGATLWSILSFYLLFFGKSIVMATIMMLAFFGWTWFFLMLINSWDRPDEPAQVSLGGRIQN